MITIISGTNRLENKSLRVAQAYSKICEELNCEAQILDLQTIPKDFIFSASYGSQNADFDAIVENYIASCDKFIFVVPEYNGSFPGMLKGFIDCVKPELWHDKKAAMIGLSSGKAGNLRGLDHLTGVMHYLQVEVLSKKPKLSAFHTLIDEKGHLTDGPSIELMRAQVRKFLDF
jgi:NAD(P)H-dependent FMN reductase